MGNGVISAEDLAMRLVSAKKILNTDVKSTKRKNNDYVGYEDDETPINESVMYSDPEGLLDTQQMVNIPRNTSAPSINRINESRLPDNIKRAMIETPIVQPEISLTNSLDIKLVEKAKKLMEQDNGSNRQTQQTRQPAKQQPISNNGGNININEMINAFTPIIENTIRKVLDEKLTQILTAKDTASINENLVLKVGDSIFKGKITGVRPSK